MNKTELEAYVAEQEEIINQMEEVLGCLETRLSNHKVIKPGRKEQCLEILKIGPISNGAIAKRVGISARNVSSQLSYLRKDGHNIGKTSTGKHVLLKQITCVALRGHTTKGG